jgi:hypothetical protein
VNSEGDIMLYADFKLTKADKRELKFAAKRGEDVNEKL